MKATWKYQGDFQCQKLVKEVADHKDHLLLEVLGAVLHQTILLNL